MKATPEEWMRGVEGEYLTVPPRKVFHVCCYSAQVCRVFTDIRTQSLSLHDRSSLTLSLMLLWFSKPWARAMTCPSARIE